MCKFSMGTNFHGQETSTEIKPTKICTDEELATASTASYSHPRKFIPTKINLRNIVILKISTFMVSSHVIGTDKSIGMVA